MMSDSDERLIEQAEAMNFIYWHEIDALIEQAQSEEAKKRLTRIQQLKYHTEEYYAGCL